MKNHTQAVRDGLRDGTPIAVGYFAVAFSLGIAARNAGLNPLQGFLASLFTLASAGEYAAFTMIGENASYIGLTIMILITNARYLLMSCSLSQRFSEKTPFFHRLLVAFGITDEIFGISISREGELDPFYNYAAIAVAAPSWAVATALGIVMGNLLPANIVSALSVALYGMFLAIIIPPARENRVIGVLVPVSFAASFLCSTLPVVSGLSGGNRTMILTVLLSALAAVLFPVKGETEEEEII